MSKFYTPQEKNKVLDMHAEGKSYKEISEALGRGIPSIRAFVRKYNGTGQSLHIKTPKEIQEEREKMKFRMQTVANELKAKKLGVQIQDWRAAMSGVWYDDVDAKYS
jgi:transposase